MLYKEYFRLKFFPFFPQLSEIDCGPTCLKIISKYFGRKYFNYQIEELSIDGVSISKLENIANTVGFDSVVAKTSFDSLYAKAPLPFIAHWNQNHYVVVYKMTKKYIYVADPAFGKTKYTYSDFLNGWSQGDDEGIVLLLEPNRDFFKVNTQQTSKREKISYILKYLPKFKSNLLVVTLTLLVSSGIELILPFFTQKIIDKGVFENNLKLIHILLLAQAGIFISRIALEFYRSWIFIQISSRISLSIISEFLAKLMKLPLKFFNSRNLGDLTRRIQDHKRIEEFLSKDLIQTFFSIFSLILFGVILCYFNVTVFLIIFMGTIIQLIWIFGYLKRIRILDQKTFSLNAKDQNKIFELITGMQDIKLNNLEDHKRMEWQKIQTNIYQNNIKKLKINQQYESYRFISFFQNLFVVFVSALAIMNHQMTIGTMISITYIVGAINSPITQLINFILQFNLTKQSFERLNEIHNRQNEENSNVITHITEIQDIIISNVSFSYNDTTPILKDITLTIPKGKTTAIVGVSGSGKTTLLKILLKFYKPQQGKIFLNNSPLDEIDNKFWRDKCGVILQDSFLFSETIAYNIALEENPDYEKLFNSIKLANIDTFIESLTNKENTLIGAEGNGISHGQKQRILIARAIYKNPDYLFFDEATNALDTKNEKIIVENINSFFKNKTMIVVAHRLSTVKNADQIIVLDNGEIIEIGNHEELIKIKGKYFELIQNQLELGQ
jgi:ATP-binding cassette, subfamily B, bacterial